MGGGYPTNPLPSISPLPAFLSGAPLGRYGYESAYGEVVLNEDGVDAKVGWWA